MCVCLGKVPSCTCSYGKGHLILSLSVLSSSLSLSLLIGLANSYTVVAVSINNNTGSSLMAGNTLAFTINCTVMVDCMSDPCDNDTLTILWSLNGETISGTHFTVSNPRSFNITNELDDSASMLTLLGPVNISHAGVYTCNATLESGASNTSNGTLTVQGMMLNPVLVIFYVVKIL